MKPGISYVTGSSVPQFFDEESQKGFVQKWQTQHSQDHANIFGILNNLQATLKRPLLELPMQNLNFNSEDMGSVNAFLKNNNWHHQLFYQWENDLGALLPGYNKPPMIVYPLLNPMLKLLRIDRATLNEFMYHEQRVHNMTLSALNNLFAAYGV